MRTAITHRVGEENGPGSTFNNGANNLLEAAVENLEEVGHPLDEFQQALLKTFMEEKLGELLKPEHYSFRKYLKKTVKPNRGVKEGFKDTLNFQLCDMSSIEKAWDMYVDEKQPLLPTMSEYRDQYNERYTSRGFKSKQNPKSQEKRFRTWKKEWVLFTRRREIIEKRKWAMREALIAALAAEEQSDRESRETSVSSRQNSQDLYDRPREKVIPGNPSPAINLQNMLDEMAVADPSPGNASQLSQEEGLPVGSAYLQSQLGTSQAGERIVEDSLPPRSSGADTSKEEMSEPDTETIIPETHASQISHTQPRAQNAALCAKILSSIGIREATFTEPDDGDRHFKGIRRPDATREPWLFFHRKMSRQQSKEKNSYAAQILEDDTDILVHGGAVYYTRDSGYEGINSYL